MKIENIFLIQWISVKPIWFDVHLKAHYLTFLTHVRSCSLHIFSIFCGKLKLSADFEAGTVWISSIFEKSSISIPNFWESNYSIEVNIDAQKTWRDFMDLYLFLIMLYSKHVKHLNVLRPYVLWWCMVDERVIMKSDHDSSFLEWDFKLIILVQFFLQKILSQNQFFQKLKKLKLA